MRKGSLPFGAREKRRTPRINSLVLQCTDRNIWKLVSEAENKALDYKLSRAHGVPSPYTFLVYGNELEIKCFQEFLNKLAEDA